MSWRCKHCGSRLTVKLELAGPRELPITLIFRFLFPFLFDAVALERAPGYCIRCGYNLTGNTSGICPECGEAIAPRHNSEKAG